MLTNYLKLKDFISSIKDGSIFQFNNREMAGKILFQILTKFKNNMNDQFLVLCIPRGGVIIGDIITDNFHCNFGIVMPRRLIAPHNNELSIGSIMKDGFIYLKNDLVSIYHISDDYIQRVKNEKIKEIHQMELLYNYEQIDKNSIRSRKIILVDDGAATGSTLITASRWIKQFHPEQLIIAIPVCNKEILTCLKTEGDNIISIINPSSVNFTTVSQFYKDFSTVSDEKIIEILKKYKVNEFNS